MGRKNINIEAASENKPEKPQHDLLVSSIYMLLEAWELQREVELIIAAYEQEKRLLTDDKMRLLYPDR